jgi:hypothetical protein
VTLETDPAASGRFAAPAPNDAGTRFFFDSGALLENPAELTKANSKPLVQREARNAEGRRQLTPVNLTFTKIPCARKMPSRVLDEVSDSEDLEDGG